MNCTQYQNIDLAEKFQQNQLDIIITNSEFFAHVSKEQCEAHLIYNKSWRLALNINNPLAQAPEICIEDLSNQNIINLYNGSLTAARQSFGDRFWLPTMDYVNSHETKLLLVEADRGVALIPPFLDAGNYPNVVMRDFTPTYFGLTHYVICKKDNLNPRATMLKELLLNYYVPKLI